MVKTKRKMKKTLKRGSVRAKGFPVRRSSEIEMRLFELESQSGQMTPPRATGRELVSIVSCVDQPVYPVSLLMSTRKLEYQTL